VPERASVFESTRIGIEPNPGGGGNASVRLLSTDVMPSVQVDVQTHRPRGSRFGTIGVNNKEWSEAQISQDVASYTDPAYLFSNIFGSPDIRTPGGATDAREQIWNPGLLNFTAVTPKTFVVETGSFKRAQKFEYGLVKSIGMDYDRDGVSLSGDMLGLKITDGVTLSGGTNEVQTLTVTGTPTSGDIDLAFMGETFTVPYNGTSGAVQSLINALPNIEAGDVTVGGGALPGVALTFTFGGKYAKLDVPEIVVVANNLSGGSTPSAAITETTPGVALTSLPMQPISGSEWDIYVDDSAANLGNTKLPRCFSCSWNISDMYGPVWVGDTANPSFAAHVDLAPTTEFKMMVEADGTGMGFLDDLRAGDHIFVRLPATGPEIESGQNFLLRPDFCVLLTDISDYSDEDGVIAVEYTGEIHYDDTWGTAFQILMRNAIAAIS
jgi:hypothetical protein